MFGRLTAQQIIYFGIAAGTEASVEGEPFGRYRLVSLLGRGGMGEVWQAYDTGTDRMVALKVLRTHFAEDETFEVRFRREAHAAARLHHPHIVPIHDYGEIDGRLFVDMALVSGRDLASVIAEAPLEPSRAVAIVEQIARALQAAHRIGLVHRDVKPSNILLDEDDNAYLIDFGIARAVNDTALTGTGTALGTAAYMAPERLTTNDTDARCDVYSLACVLHECLTGKQPYPGDSLPSQVAGHLYSPPPRPSETKPGIPAALDDVVVIGMAKKVEDRYPTTTDLAGAARTALTTRPTESIAAEPESTATLPHASAASAQTAPASLTLHSSPTTVAPTADTSAGADSTAPGGVRRRPRRKIVIAAIALVGTVAVAVGAYAVTRDDASIQAASGEQTQSTAPRTYGEQVRLPFTGLVNPGAVEVDTAGNVYVTDFGNDTDGAVLMMAADSTAQTRLPFTGIKPNGIAVDPEANIYVSDSTNDRVLSLGAGSSVQSVLPLRGLGWPSGLAVHSGSLYIANPANPGVTKAATNGANQTDLPLTGLDNPTDVAVDAKGNVYVCDTNKNQIVMLAADTAVQSVLPFTGLAHPTGVAADTGGNVYVLDDGNRRVLMLAAGSATQTVLPMTDLGGSSRGIAVDDTGNVYLTSNILGGPTVFKLPVS